MTENTKTAHRIGDKVRLPLHDGIAHRDGDDAVWEITGFQAEGRICSLHLVGADASRTAGAVTKALRPVFKLSPKAQRKHDRWVALVEAEGYTVGQSVLAARVTTDARDYVKDQWWETAVIVEIRNFDAVVQFADGSLGSSGLGLRPLDLPAVPAAVPAAE